MTGLSVKFNQIYKLCSCVNLYLLFQHPVLHTIEHGILCLEMKNFALTNYPISQVVGLQVS